MNAQILIVEDNADNMKLMEWMLEDAGYMFDMCTTGEDAVRKVEQKDYDMVLMDISLPGMDGKEATRQIRMQPRFATLPIIAVTAHAVRGEDTLILESGVSALVTKPIDESELMDVIANFSC